MRIRRIWLVLGLVTAGLVVTAGLTSCSPWYVMRAGWEEAGILWRREDILELQKRPEIDAKLKQTLESVLGARAFAETLGLKPGGSFTQYSEIDRDVLVWVLSACRKTSLTPKTWWFPIVGRIPYKGFFEKEDGLQEARELENQGFDIFLRPSAAFSTLGWFNDPFLSTMKNFDQVALVNTVIHEILHNTVWIPNHATFNETLANVVGAAGAIEYFRAQGAAGQKALTRAENRWHDEQMFAAFLDDLQERLTKFYASHGHVEGEDDKEPTKEFLEKRMQFFAEARARWEQNTPNLKGDEYKDISRSFNNAVIIAQRTYLDRVSLFSELLANCGNSAACLIEESKLIAEDMRRESGLSPFTALARRAAERTS